MTLADSVEAITYCFNRVAEDKGLPAVTSQEVGATIGLPFTEACMRLWGRGDPELLAWYGDHYREDEFSRMKLFPDAPGVLTRLRHEGMRTGVVTNRPSFEATQSSPSAMAREISIFSRVNPASRAIS